MALPAGTRLGPYEILAPLGAGGMGEVYRARDSRLGRDVALKVLPDERASDPDRLRRFETEARAIASLNHPHILSLYDVGTHDGVPYAVTELLEGRTLRSVLERGALPARKVVDYGVQICQGLAAAHERGVIHRDLKPENLFLTRDGQIKILDFGLARLTGPPEEGHADREGPTATEPGLVMGTAAYMSPEQARGRPADARSDLFALGAILYEMLSGRHAFSGDTAADTMSAVLDKDPPEIQSTAGAVPPGLERVVKRCLEKSPQERIQSARDLAFDLEALSTQGDVSRRSGHWLLVAAAVVAVLAVTGGVVWLRHRSDPRPPVAEASVAPKRIVVLPFENLGAPEDAYFAAGMTDEITGRLAQVSGLGVISRTSAVQYDRTGKTTRQIGEELDVGYVLAGTVRWDRPGEGPGRVRITPELIRVADDTHVWVDSYDRVLDDIFGTQSEIAGAVVEHLDVTLLPQEQEALAARPTQSLEAYQAYLRGLEHLRDLDGTRDSRARAVQSFERAVELDPSFVAAHASLSRAHLFMSVYDRTPERLASAREAADRALALDPESPDAHLALGLYYQVADQNRERALEEYLLVARRRPNDSDALWRIAEVRESQGRFDETIAQFQKLFALDPRNPLLAQALGNNCRLLGRYSEANRYYDIAIALAPDKSRAYDGKAASYMEQGRLDRARAPLESAPESDWFFFRLFWVDLERRTRNYQAALDRLSAARAEVMWVQFSLGWKEVAEGLLHRLMKQPERARASYEAAVAILEDAVAKHPEDEYLGMRLAQAYAGLGRKADAVREADRVVAMAPVSRNAQEGTAVTVWLAEAYTTAGEHEKALELLESLASIPSWMSYGYLRYEPALDPLRDAPRFQKLLADKKKQLHPSPD